MMKAVKITIISILTVMLILVVAGAAYFQWRQRPTTTEYFSSVPNTSCAASVRLYVHRQPNFIEGDLVSFVLAYRAQGGEEEVVFSSSPIFSDYGESLRGTFPYIPLQESRQVTDDVDPVYIPVPSSSFSEEEFQQVGRCLHATITELNDALVRAYATEVPSFAKGIQASPVFWGIIYVSSQNNRDGSINKSHPVAILRELNTDGDFRRSDYSLGIQVTDDGTINMPGEEPLGDVFSGVQVDFSKWSYVDMVGLVLTKNKRGETVFQYVERLRKELRERGVEIQPVENEKFVLPMPADASPKIREYVAQGNSVEDAIRAFGLAY